MVEILYWWILKNACNEDMIKDNKVWCYCSSKGFERYLPYMSWQKIRRTLKKVEDGGILVTGNFNKRPTDQTLWYAFSHEGIEILEGYGYDFSKMKNGIFKNEKSNINNINLINNKKNNKEEEKSISNDIPKKEQRHKNFVKPTIEEIDAYIKSMGYKSSAEEFFNYHEAGGWVIGRNKPMRDWRAAVRTWESKERKKRPTAYDVNPEDKIKEIKFKSYMREKYPDIETAHKPLSFDGYMELVRDYGVDYVTEKLDHIVTYFGKYKGCDIYKLIKSWLSEDGRD